MTRLENVTVVSCDGCKKVDKPPIGLDMPVGWIKAEGELRSHTGIVIYIQGMDFCSPKCLLRHIVKELDVMLYWESRQLEHEAEKKRRGIDD